MRGAWPRGTAEGMASRVCGGHGPEGMREACPREYAGGVVERVWDELGMATCGKERSGEGGIGLMLA